MSGILVPKPMLGRQLSAGRARGLVGYWLFNEGSGNIVSDLSGNGETGIIDATGVWVSGKFGSCIKFDGTDTKIELGTAISDKIAIPGADFTFSVWVNVSGFPEANRGAIICVFGTAIIQLSWRRAGDGEYFECFVDYVTSDAYTKSRDIGDAAVTNVWTHIVAVHKDSTKTTSFFINGVEETNYIEQTAGVGARVDRSGYITYIGNNYNTSQSFNGLIDLPMIYNRALTAREITELYEKSFAMFEREPLPLWTAATQGVAPTGIQTYMHHYQQAS